MAFKQ